MSNLRIQKSSERSCSNTNTTPFAATITNNNQSVENAGVAFVKGTDERIFFLNKQSVMNDEQVRTNKAKD